MPLARDFFKRSTAGAYPSCLSASTVFKVLMQERSPRLCRTRGFYRYSLSAAAPFVWQCLNSCTITLFPHPPHRTGHAEFPQPALGQDTYLCTRKVICSFTRSTTQSRVLRRTSTERTAPNRQCHHLGGHLLPGSQSGFFLRFSMWCLPQRLHTFQEFPRVAPISRALPLSAPVLN